MLPSTNIAVDSPATCQKRRLQTAAPLAAHVHSATSAHKIPHSWTLPLRTSKVRRYASPLYSIAPLYSMGNIPHCPTGPIHASRPSVRARKSLPDERSSSRRPRRTETGSRRCDMPSRNIRVARPRYCWAHLSVGLQESHYLFRRGLPSRRLSRI